MTIAGPSSKLRTNGEIALDSVTVGIPQASLNLRFDNQPVRITDSKLNFNQFKIFTQGKSPFRINGDVDFSDMANMTLDLQMNASNFEVFNAKRTKESLVYGKLNVDFNSRVKGRVDALVVRGNMNILGSSDFTYILKDSPLTVEDRLGETVTFVNFNDTHRYPETADSNHSAGRHRFADDAPYRRGRTMQGRPERKRKQLHAGRRRRRPVLPVHTGRKRWY